MEAEGAPSPTPPTPPDDSSKEFRQWAMFLHLSMLLGFVVPLAGLVAPIVIWQIKKEEMPAIDAHGKVALNWILSALIHGVGCFILSFILIGIPLMIALALLTIIFPIIAGIKANEGTLWKYPLSIPFLK